tara:strand:+ start:4222 stop:4440 length:219 start_codon:yes stop_codon:yes gene_type:complete
MLSLRKKKNKVQIDELQSLIKKLIEIKKCSKDPEFVINIEKEIVFLNQRQCALSYPKEHDSAKNNGKRKKGL